MFEKFFALSAHGTSIRRETVAGATTFLILAYIMFMNPISRRAPMTGCVAGHRRI